LFYEKCLKDLVPLQDYTIDMNFKRRKRRERTERDQRKEKKEEEEEEEEGLKMEDIVVIEINPPTPRAGTSLFNFGFNEKDRRIVQEGPREFRVRTQEMVDLREKYRENFLSLSSILGLDSLLPKEREVAQEVGQEEGREVVGLQEGDDDEWCLL